MEVRGRALLRTWIPVVSLAELLGFAPPAVVGVVTAGSPTAVSLPAVVAAGAVEGVLLGAGQVLVLRRVLPAVSASRWIVATAVAAALAHVLGLLPSAAASSITAWPPAIQVAQGAVLGLLLLVSIGAAQWWELRRHVEGGAIWIGVTALAWLLGLGVFLAVATPLWRPGQPVPVAVAVGLVAGALMAVVMASVTGLGLVHLLARTARARTGTSRVPFGPGPDDAGTRGSDASAVRDEERS